MDWNNLEPDKYCLLSSRFTPGRGGAKIEYIYVHHMAFDGTCEELKHLWETSRAASAHYGVEQDGTIGQLVNDWDTAWSVANSVENRRSINIEHANNAFGPSWTISPETLDSGAHLVAALCRAYNLGEPRWRVNVGPHSDVVPTGCPGAIAGSQNQEYMARAVHYYHNLTEEQSMSTQPITLDDEFQSLVKGSKLRDKLWRFILHADRNSFNAAKLAHINSQRLERIEHKIDRLLEER